MKFTAATCLLLSTLALASPAPVAKSDAEAEPVLIESRAPIRNAVAAREAIALPAIELEERSTSGGKGSKGGKGSGSKGNNTENAASDMLSPSRVLQVTALGLGVIEVVTLWG
jgi:hypothetical protein